MIERKKRKLAEKFQRFLKVIYIKLFRIHDSPFKIALGFGLGVFTGIMPGVGPIATLVLAFLLRANRASALMGCIILNTWLGVVVFAFAVKTGSAVMGLSYKDVYDGWSLFIKNFNFSELFKLSIYKIIAPISLGYLIISFCAGIFVFITSFSVMHAIRSRKLLKAGGN